MYQRILDFFSAVRCAFFYLQLNLQLSTEQSYNKINELVVILTGVVKEKLFHLTHYSLMRWT